MVYGLDKLGNFYVISSTVSVVLKHARGLKSQNQKISYLAGLGLLVWGVVAVFLSGRFDYVEGGMIWHALTQEMYVSCSN